VQQGDNRLDGGEEAGSDEMALVWTIPHEKVRNVQKKGGSVTYLNGHKNLSSGGGKNGWADDCEEFCVGPIPGREKRNFVYGRGGAHNAYRRAMPHGGWSKNPVKRKLTRD